MSRVTGRNELVRAALDSIAYQVRDVVDLIVRSSPLPVSELNADGGATRNPYLMQLQADLLNIPVKVPRDAELSGMGAAHLAAIAAGLYGEDVLQQDRTAAVYTPAMPEAERQEKIAGWTKAVQTALHQAV